jgi:cell division protein FtsQ
MDPRFRARLLAVRREQGRHRLRFVGAVLVAVVVGAGALGITHLPVLAVHHVEVSGGAHTPTSDVVAVAGLGGRPLMIHVSPGRIAGRVTRLPWVESAVVRRRWPTTVTIRLTERQPIALVPAGAAGQALVDGAGRVLAVEPPPAASPGAEIVGGGLPVIVGLDSPGPAGSSLGGGTAPASALAVVKGVDATLPARLSSGVTRVSVTADGEVVLAVRPAITAVLGPTAELPAKLVALGAILEQTDLRGAVTIDLRVPDTPVLTRGGRGGTVSTTAGG